MEEEREKNGRGQQEPYEKEGAEAMAHETIAPQPTAPSRPFVVLSWVLFAISVIIALVLAVQLIRERQINAKLSERVSSLESAVFSARKVFLERAAAELGYASVDLQADPPKRYQVAFRLDEASRWLRDAEPLLSDSGRTQAQSLQQALRQLPALVEQDPVSARQELAKIQDALERLMSSETRAK
jgi:hypothetical protein